MANETGSEYASTSAFYIKSIKDGITQTTSVSLSTSNGVSGRSLITLISPKKLDGIEGQWLYFYFPYYIKTVTGSNTTSQVGLSLYRIFMREDYSFFAYPQTTSLIDVATSNTVQTISAKKTFSVLPESSVVPTLDNQLVNKKYVDDTIASSITDALGGSY